MWKTVCGLINVLTNDGIAQKVGNSGIGWENADKYKLRYDPNVKIETLMQTAEEDLLPDVVNAAMATNSPTVSYGSDCSGIDVGAYCLRRLGVPFTQLRQ